MAPAPGLAGSLKPLGSMLSDCAFQCIGGFQFEECAFFGSTGAELDEALGPISWVSEVCLRPAAGFPDLFFEGFGTAATTEGDRPAAIATATAISDEDSEAMVIAAGDFRANAFLNYFARVEQISIEPAFQPDVIPVTAEAAFSRSGSSACSNTGQALIRFGNTVILRWQPNHTSQPTESVNLLLPVGGILVIALSATSVASTGAGALFTDCSATMDPLLTFDQAAFDAQWGAASFPLADFYEIRTSAEGGSGGTGACPLVPATGCHVAEKASLSIVEKKLGKEKLKATFKGFQTLTTLADLGDPAAGDTRYELCIYDGTSQLVSGLTVDRAGESCGPKQKPCWSAKGDKGYAYKDAGASASGVTKISAAPGGAGKGKLQIQGKNNSKKDQDALPTGVASLLQGATTASIQVNTSDAGCFEAAFSSVKKADGAQFKAKSP